MSASNFPTARPTPRHPAPVTPAAKGGLLVSIRRVFGLGGGVQNEFESQRKRIAELEAAVAQLQARFSPTAADESLLAKVPHRFPPLVGEELAKTTTTFSALKLTARGTAIVVGTELAGLSSFVKKAGTAALEVQSEKDSPIEALARAKNDHVPFIVCGDRFSEQTPLDQIRFLKLASEKLAKGGALALLLPNLRNPEISADLYWTSYLHARPYSITQLQATLPFQMIPLAVRGGNRVLLIYRKV